MTDNTDLIRRLHDSPARPGGRWPTIQECREAAQALEDAARENAELRKILSRMEVEASDRACSLSFAKRERDALAVQVAQAREVLDKRHTRSDCEHMMSTAYRILSDPDPSARLRTIQADAWQEGAEAVAVATLPGAAKLTNPYRTEDDQR